MSASTNANANAADNALQRIGKRELTGLLERSSERDKALLQSLSDYRYLLTGQMQRLYFRRSTSQLAALRATNRSLGKLQDWKLVTTLARRIGGVRAGSSSYVWTLTPAGYRLLDLLNRANQENCRQARKRNCEPSSAFLQHTLAVAEVAIRLSGLAAENEIGLLERQVEPDCWRSFINTGGTSSTLRPDLFAITSPVAIDATENYEDHWFFEVDLATESPCTVVRKCQQYLAYMSSGEEQKRYGVFPLVVWIVPDAKRQASLLAHITENLPEDKGLFMIIVLDQLEWLVLTGAIDELPDQTS